MDLVRDYAEWIDRKRSVHGGDIHPTTKSDLLGALRLIIDTLRDDPAYEKRLDPTLYVPRMNWSNSDLESQARSALSIDQIIKIYRTCLADAENTLIRFRHVAALIEANRNRIPTAPNRRGDFLELGVCLAAMDDYFSQHAIKMGNLKATNSKLRRAVATVHKSENTFDVRYIGSDDLVPFVILLTWRTLFNPDSVLALTWSQIQPYNWFFGAKHWDISPGPTARIGINASKGRSHSDQPRTFAAKPDRLDNPCGILTAIREMTAPLRSHLADRDSDRVFVFLPRISTGVPRSFGYMNASRSGDICWQFALRRYIKKHRLPKFTLANLRATGVDFLDKLTDGDLRAIQRITNHRNTATIQKHYVSPAAKKRGEDRLGIAMAYRDRWVGTDGVADARGLRGNKGQPAATPGFLCMDPLSSPVEGQKQGVLCTAVGSCPTCPMAAVRRNDPHALATLLVYRDALKGSAETLSPARYLESVQPQLIAITRAWLPAFSEKAWDSAAKYRAKCITPLIE